MGIGNWVAASIAATSLVISVPASAATGGAFGAARAEKVRKLDIMLMVTGLRCRKTADNFQADYGRFTSNHIAELNAASTELKTDLARRYGEAGAARALDKLSVSMANQYGQGHPWLDCAQLRTVTRNLAIARGAEPLVAAADQLLGARPEQFALAGQPR